MSAPNSAKEMWSESRPHSSPDPSCGREKTLAEAGRIHIPRKLFRPAESFFNRLDSARNTFELRPTDTATNRNPNPREKYGRAEGATLGLNSRQTQFPPRFSTLRVAPRLPIQKYESHQKIFHLYTQKHRY
jgi:hypothetical protein